MIYSIEQRAHISLSCKSIFPGENHISTYEEIRRPAIFAHRGSSAYAPENTLAAFKLAVQHHADGIELDAKLSADGQVVVIHDPIVDRTTDGTGQINSLTLPELKKLDAGIKFNPTFQTERIPTLAEVFETIGDQVIINIELTNYLTPIDELPDKVITLIIKYGLESSVIISSFNFIALLRAHSLHPKLPLGLLTFKSLAIPTIRSKLIRFGQNLGLHANHEDVSPELVKATQLARCKLHAYTVTQAEEMHRLFSIGVDGLYTPDPILAQNVLESIHP